MNFGAVIAILIRYHFEKKFVLRMLNLQAEVVLHYYLIYGGETGSTGVVKHWLRTELVTNSLIKWH